MSVTTIFPSIFGATQTVSASAMAANPFINFAKIFSLPNGVVSGAKYANSLWVYPLLLNANGAPAYTAANPGALPDTSACTGGTGSVAAAGGPNQIVCGSYVMIASTMYASKGLGYTTLIQGVSTTSNNGVVANPATPVGVTATTPLGIAFRSIAGGNYLYSGTPGVYGYSITNPGTNPPTYARAPGSNCIYPYSTLVYNTAAQTWATTASPQNGEPGYTQMVPWSPLITHWFYSSYLGNSSPPSQSEITLQGLGPIALPSVPNDAAQSNGNIYTNYSSTFPTYNGAPAVPVPSTCPATTTTAGVTVSNSKAVQMTYPTVGNTNCSLYIAASTSSTYVPPSASYNGKCFSPTATPGQQYAAISCQSFGSGYYTFYWNDMGGASVDGRASDDNKNYGDGVVTLACNGSGLHVTLIN